MNVTWQTYGATLFDDGTLLVDPAVFFPAFGYDYPFRDEVERACALGDIMEAHNLPHGWKASFVEPQRN